VLSVTKARVDGIDKDCTKTGEDRQIQLCPRAVAILERQLQVRTRLMEQHGIQHEPHLFVTDEGRSIPDVKYPYPRWERTLKRLRIRYRRPYVARHTSVSWNLMMSRNPLLIAKEHGHRILTMLTVYAAWTRGRRGSGLLGDPRCHVSHRPGHASPSVGHSLDCDRSVSGHRTRDFGNRFPERSTARVVRTRSRRER
jgi:hypothetical protein